MKAKFYFNLKESMVMIINHTVINIKRLITTKTKVSIRRLIPFMELNFLVFSLKKVIIYSFL